MDKNDIEQLATAFHSSEQITAAITNIIEHQGAYVTKRAIRAMWENPTSEERDLIKKQAMLFAILDGLKNGDELFWGDETFVIDLPEIIEVKIMTNKLFSAVLRARRAELQLTPRGYVNYLNKLLTDKNPELPPVIFLEVFNNWEAGRLKPSKFLVALLSVIGEYTTYSYTQKTNKLSPVFPDALLARRDELQLTQSGYENRINKSFTDKNPELPPLKTTKLFPDALLARRAELKLTQTGYVNHLNKLFTDKSPELPPVISTQLLHRLEDGSRNPSPYLIVLLSIIGEYTTDSYAQKTNKLSPVFPDALLARRAELKLTRLGYVNYLNKLLTDKNPELPPVISTQQIHHWEHGHQKPTNFLAALLSIIGEFPYSSIVKQQTRRIKNG